MPYKQLDVIKCIILKIKCITNDNFNMSTRLDFLSCKNHDQKCIFRLAHSCAHIGAALFVLAACISSGESKLESDPSCTSIPMEWNNPKGQ